jgi:hypothetical protein
VTRWRKRPVTVEAVRWTGGNAAELAAFTGSRFDVVDPEDRCDDPDITAQVFDVLHSTWAGLRTGQWVIKGVRGEFYPCDDGVLAETYEPATAADPAGDADVLPWPSWLENLSNPERIRVIVAAVDACAAGHGPPVRPHEASEQHCTASMAEHFLAKMLAPDPADDQVSVSQADLRARVTALADRWERESDELRARHVAEGLHPLLASGDRDANAMRGRAADLRAVLAGDPR